MSRPMNDEEVLSEMNKMVAFIRQEALEKAREIKVKADEEFAIEKAKIVRQESQAIDAAFEKKVKGADTARKISQSTQTNKSRLRLLQSRDEYLADLFATARNQLLALSSHEGRYVQLLEGIITQGFLQMHEESVTLHVRPPDERVVGRAAASAAQAYKGLSGRDVQFTVQCTLPRDSAGGVRLVSGNGRITIDNTLDERLHLLEEQMLPEIRTDLFGLNENRKFYT